MLNFESVEAFTINTDDSALGDESVRVYLIYQSEYNRRFPFLGQHKKHLNIVTRIKTLGIDNCSSTVRIEIDSASYLFMFFGYNKELHRTASGIDNLIYTKCSDIKYYITINNLFPTM